MSYVPYEWKDGVGGKTPITAERLNHIEQGISDIEITPGVEGPKGPKGDKGDKGDDGAKGDNGFPTEAQWDALIARVEALEEP